MAELVAERRALEEDLGWHAGGAERAGDLEVAGLVGLRVLHRHHREGGCLPLGLDQALGFEEVIQPGEADRCPDAREGLVGEDLGEVVVAPAGTDTAPGLLARHEGLEDRARVVIEPAGYRQVGGDGALLDAHPDGLLHDRG